MDERKDGSADIRILKMSASGVYREYLPLYLYSCDSQSNRFLQSRVRDVFALEAYCSENSYDGERTSQFLSVPETGDGKRENGLGETESADPSESSEEQRKNQEAEKPKEDRMRELEELFRTENEAAVSRQKQPETEEPAVSAEPAVSFSPHTRQTVVGDDILGDYELLLETFYTVDKNTAVGWEQIQPKKLMARDMTLQESDTSGPQILIYHTHSQEAFADSVEGDESTSIMGVGERLAQILEERYGYSVLHHLEKYDVESRNDAYSEALPEIEALLADNPSIQVVIDLHRDEMAEETRLVMDVDGRPTARFMFFNGLSYTRKTGAISYLKNDHLEDNLAFSFQMEKAAMEYYPGLTRKIYLKGYRYNMHLCAKTLLVELGAQNNTVEEAMNACDPLAHILHLVLSGQSGEDGDPSNG